MQAYSLFIRGLDKNVKYYYFVVHPHAARKIKFLKYYKYKNIKNINFQSIPKFIRLTNKANS